MSFNAEKLSILLDARLRGRGDAGALLVALLGPEVRWTLLRAAVAYFLQASLNAAAPVSIYLLLRWFESVDPPITWGVLCVLCNGLAVNGQFFFSKVYATSTTMAGLRSQLAVAGLLYRRTLSLNTAEVGRFKTGELAMLLSTDVDGIADMWKGIVALTFQPFEIAGIICLLWLVVGEATLGALGLCAVSYAVSNIGGLAINHRNARCSAFSDQRLKYLAEVLYGIKVVKAIGWVPRFHQRIHDVALLEAKHALQKKLYIGLVMLFSDEMIDVMALVCLLLAVLLCGQEPRASRLFTMWIFMGVLHGKIFSFPENLRMSSTAWASLRRCAAFFVAVDSEVTALAELTPTIELSSPAVHGVVQHSGDDTIGITVRSATFSFLDCCDNKRSCASVTHGDSPDLRSSWSGPMWGETENGDKLAIVLKDVNLDLVGRRLYAVMGHVGSGKTSLLLGLMGEMHMSDETCVRLAPPGTTSATVAYVPQEPLVFNDTVRENVLFGAPFDAIWYQEVCAACALDHDLSLFPSGDATVIGSRGINISGGQQARICLARAVYTRASFYFLDDPLAKLDVRISWEVFASAILGLLRGRTRLMATNSELVARQCDGGVISVAGGTAVLQGERLSDTAGSVEEDPVEPRDMKFELGKHKDAEEAVLPDVGIGSEVNGTSSAPLFLLTHISKGMGSPWRLAATMFLVALEVSIIEFGVYTLVLWSEDPDESEHPNAWYGCLYALCVGAELIIAHLKYMAIAIFAQAAWSNLHEAILGSVLKSSLLWLQSVPVGQVLQVFSGTMRRLEDGVFVSTAQFCFSLLILPLIIGVVLLGFPLFVFVLVFLSVVVYYVIRRFGKHADAARTRAASMRRQSLQQYMETLGGLTVVRVFPGARAVFARRFDDLVEHRAGAQAICAHSDEMKLMSLSIAGAVTYAAAAAGTVIARLLWGLSPGFAGFMLTNACCFSILLTLLMAKGQYLFELARERQTVEHLMRSIPQEPQDPHGPDSAKAAALAAGPGGWPSRGHLKIDGIEVRYRPELPPALRELSIEVRGGEHLGVVGRTGSGKSSFLLALARLVEPCVGRVLLDDVDIVRIGLLELRPHLGVLSQDPLFFSGTLRENLDPFAEHSDSDLWATIKGVGLVDLFDDSAEALATPVAELGGNYSVGQRQLLCLARVALRTPRVLLVDEATAALDATADMRVQAVVEERFTTHGTTVVQVAHRLWSIVRCQQVAVLEDGLLAEFGEPAALLAREPPAGTRFREMVGRLGEREAARFQAEALRAMASPCHIVDGKFSL